MTRPIRGSMIAAMVLGPLAYATPATGAVINVARLLAVFFALHFVLLIVVSLFSNLQWRLTPPPSCAAAYRTAGGRGPGNPGSW